MRGCLGPGREFADAHTSFNCASSVGAVDRRDSIDDELDLDQWVEAELLHVIDEPLHTGLHQATSALSRIDTNRASFTIETTSSSAKRFGSGCSLP